MGHQEQATNGELMSCDISHNLMSCWALKIVLSTLQAPKICYLIERQSNSKLGVA